MLSDHVDKRKVTNANVEYHDRIAGTYDIDNATKHIFGKYTQARIKEIISLLHKRTAGQVLLDVGCGTGNVLKYAEQHYNLSIGIDVSEEMLKICHEKNFMTLKADCYQIPLASNSVDVVSSFSVLHHLYNPSDFLAEVGRVLKKGGYLYTDWDVNAHYVAKKKSSWLFSGLLLAREILSPKSKNLDKYKKLSNLAEYHLFSTRMGLDPEKIKTELNRLGFEHIDIIYNSNCKSIFNTGKISLANRIGYWLKMFFLRSHDAKVLSPLFLIMARK